jgi:hypothetical protein
MAKNLRAGLRQSIKASRKAGVTGAGIFSLAPLDLRFALQKTLDPRVTFTRASTGTFVGSDGVLQSAITNEARFDHNPTTGESLGLLVEEARTNLLLNSATLSTQSVTVAAAANTLSFYGTGTVTLTGVSTAGPLVGTGANTGVDYLLTEDSFALMYEDDTFIYQEVANPSRVSLTFTPTVGVLILTVSGSVTNAQLEAGAFATSYIPTTTATVTRAADVASITGSAFSSWYRQDEGTNLIEFQETDRTGSRTPRSLSDGTTTNRIDAFLSSSLTVNNRLALAGVSYNPGNLTLSAAGTVNKHVLSVAPGSAIAVINGTLSTASAPPSLPVVNRIVIGADSIGGTPFTGTIRRLTYWPVRLANPTLQSITAS